METAVDQPRSFPLALASAVALSLVSATLVPATAATIPPAQYAVHSAVPGSGGLAAQKSSHVLLLSVDGMHQSDLSWYVSNHPRSALAGLLRRGTEFTRALTPFPSDSFPGLVGQLTGGHPRTTGVYYDVTYNHRLVDPSASPAVRPSRHLCETHARGANVPFDESVDRDPARLDAGQGLDHLPADILRMTGHPQRLIDPSLLPIDPTTCRRVYPHSYLRVNTVFEVAHRHGLRTAWADKHPAYEILNGPSGRGLDDLFAPEINSTADGGGDDWTKVNSLTRRYDHFKVRAVLNEIHGLDHSGRRRVGVPGIFGMNFQSVSTAEKLPTSDGQTGGYVAGGRVPGTLLRGALARVDHEIASLVTALRRTHLLRRTTVIVSAKHGQSPQDASRLKRIDDGAVIDGLNAAWQSRHAAAAQPLVAASLNDDGMLLWFSNGDRTRTAARFAASYLRHYAGTGTAGDGRAKATDLAGAPVAYTSAGLARIHAGVAAARFLGATAGDPRRPDLVGVTQLGVVYTGKTGKISEHGGNHAEDRHVPLVVAGPGTAPDRRSLRVQTTRIAPTILALLGLDPQALQAVRREHTRPLPLR